MGGKSTNTSVRRRRVLRCARVHGLPAEHRALRETCPVGNRGQGCRRHVTPRPLEILDTARRGSAQPAEDYSISVLVGRCSPVRASDFRPPFPAHSRCTLAVGCRLPHQPEPAHSVGRWVRAGPGFSYVTVFGSSQRSVQFWSVSMANKSSIVSDLHGWRTPSVSGEELQAPGKSGPQETAESRGACQFQGAKQSARVRPSGRTSAKVEAALHESSWFVAL